MQMVCMLKKNGARIWNLPHPGIIQHDIGVIGGIIPTVGRYTAVSGTILKIQQTGRNNETNTNGNNPTEDSSNRQT